MVKVMACGLCCAIFFLTAPKTVPNRVNTISSPSSIDATQQSPAPSTPAEFTRYLDVLDTRLSSWKDEIDAIPFDSLRIDSKERGHLDASRTRCLSYIKSAGMDIGRVREEHTLDQGIWLLADFYEVRDEFQTLDDDLANLYTSQDHATTMQGLALAHQLGPSEKQINESIEAILPYLAQRARNIPI